MATDATADSDLDVDDAEDEVEKGGNRKKLVLMGAAVLLLLALAAGALFLFGGDDAQVATDDEGPASLVQPRHEGPSFFYDVPDILVNLDSKGRRTTYLKISVSVEVGDEKSLKKLEKLSPRIIDNFQVYLRELRLSDLEGSAGVTRLREELLRRVRAAAEPVQVADVLFREMLIQ